MNESELLDRYVSQLLDGDKEIVANLSSQIRRYSHYFGAHRLADPQNLEAESLAAIMHNLKRGVFKGNSLRQFNAYLRSIVLNQVLKEIEHERRLDVLPSDRVPDIPTPDDSRHIDNRDLVHHVFDQLKPACREILTLKYLQDLSNAEIADKLRLREVTVRVRLSRCTEFAKGVMRSQALL